MEYSVRFVIGITVALSLFSVTVATSDDCENGRFVYCYGSRMIRSFMDKLSQSPQPLIIFPGLEIVSTLNANETENIIDVSENDTLVGRMANYLRNHELNIKFSDLLDTTNLKDYISDKLEQKQDVVEARKKHDKMYMVAISMMFGKLLAFLGITKIGALALKALAIAKIALLLTGIIGLKHLHQGGEAHSHHVQYVSDGHHRRRRESFPKPLPLLAYRGWRKTDPVQ